VPSSDSILIQIADAALAEVTRKSGSWLACRPGCSQCCLGPFAITQLDALRLRRGLAELETRDASRAARIRERVRAAAALQPEATETQAEDEPCPVLDPETQTCDLYASRPMTCRAFGPPVRTPEGVGVCELCFDGASEQQIVACLLDIDPEDREAALIEEAEQATGVRGMTSVAVCLTS